MIKTIITLILFTSISIMAQAEVKTQEFACPNITDYNLFHKDFIAKYGTWKLQEDSAKTPFFLQKWDVSGTSEQYKKLICFYTSELDGKDHTKVAEYSIYSSKMVWMKFEYKECKIIPKKNPKGPYLEQKHFICNMIEKK